MKCPKCNGLMIYEKFLDMGESSNYFFYGWRCIACGTIVDSTIIENKISPAALLKSHRRRRLKKVS
ncbi:MAG: hypothetical protein IT393_01450 [Nitrospirae bacterium]|nr:hypothetical protein [Nitrospirota bacterium]